jgi:carboxymethylenebutenolidase
MSSAELSAGPSAGPGAGSSAGAVVVHDWYGLGPHVRDFAAELEASGLVVEVVDLYDGATTTDPARAAELADALDGPTALGLVTEAARRLRKAGAPAVGAVGFSLGGSLVLRAAALGDVDAVVAYYAVRGPSDAATTACPVQLHLAEDDEPDMARDVPAYVEALEAAGTPVDTFTYPGTVHSFANLDVPLADPGAADVARSRTIGFLHARLAR